MTEQEALDTIGVAPGDYTSRERFIPLPEWDRTVPTSIEHFRRVVQSTKGHNAVLEWYGDRGAIVVLLDEEDRRVLEVRFYSYVKEEGIIAMFLQRRGLPETGR